MTVVDSECDWREPPLGILTEDPALQRDAVMLSRVVDVIRFRSNMASGQPSFAVGGAERSSSVELDDLSLPRKGGFVDDDKSPDETVSMALSFDFFGIGPNCQTYSVP